MSRADDLVEEHLRGGLDAAALDAGLRGEVAAQPEAVTAALMLLRLHGQLAAESRPAGLSGRIMAVVAGQARSRVRDSVLVTIRQLPRPRRRRLAWIGVGLAAAALLLVGVTLGWPLARSSGVSVASGAWLRADGASISSGALPRQAVGSSASGGVVLRWGDGSLAEVAGDSHLHLADDDLAIDTGSVRCTVSPHAAAAPFVVRTPHATVTVVGTVFTIAVGAATTCRVERGVVDFASGGQERRLEAGAVMTSDALSAAPSGWELEWSDEFAADGVPDAQRWRDWARPSGINTDIQHYLPGLARVADGALFIEARHGASGWTSTSLLAQGLMLRPGMRVELRAQLPVAPGVWPLIWAVQPERWPSGPEAVLLTTGGAPARLRASLRLAPTTMVIANGPPLLPAASTYAIVWTEAGLTLWRDGVSVCTVIGPGDSAWTDACASGLRLAIELSVTAEAAPVPARMLIEWVRVYRRAASK